MKFILKLLPLLKFLGFFSRRLLLNILTTIFITPFRYPTPEREQVFYKSAKHKKMVIPSINKEIVIYEYGYSRTKDLLIHGWSGRGSQFYRLADKLLENGRMVISFDAPAHGNSEGKQTGFLEYIEIIKHLNNVYHFDTAIGHSIGGMSLLKVTSLGEQFKKIVVIGVTNQINEVILKFLSRFNLGEKYIQPFKDRFKDRFGLNFDDYNGEACAKEITIPVLIIHDSKDKQAGVRSAYDIRQSLRDGELLITNDLGHTRILKDNTVNNKIVRFIKNKE